MTIDMSHIIDRSPATLVCYHSFSWFILQLTVAGLYVVELSLTFTADVDDSVRGNGHKKSAHCMRLSYGGSKAAAFIIA